MQQEAIDQMNDGLGKELAQTQLNHEKKLETIRSQAEEEAKEIAEANYTKWAAEQIQNKQNASREAYYASEQYKLLAKNNGLSDTQRAEVDRDKENKLKEEQKRNQKQIDDILSKYLRKYNVYTERRLEIEKKYNADVAALTKKREEYAKAGKDTTEIDNAITQALKDQKDALIDLNAEYTELNTLIAESESLGKRIETIRSGGTDIEGKTLEELEKAKKEVDKKIKSLQQKSFKELWDEQKNTLVANSLNQVTDALYGLAEVSGSLNAEQAAKFMDSLSKGVQGFQQGSWVGILVAGIEDTIAQFSNELIAAEAMASAVDGGKLDKWTADMDKLMNQGDSIFGSDAVANVNGAVTALDEARKKLHEFGEEEQSLGEWNVNRALELTNAFALSSLFPAFALFKDTFDDDRRNDVIAYFDAIGKGYTELESHVLRTRDRGWLLEMFGTQDQFDNIRDMVEGLGYDLYDQYGNLNAEALQEILNTYTDLSEEDRKWLEEGIAYSEKYQEAMEQIAEYLESLFGNIADTIADQMVEAFIETGDAAIDLGKVVGEVGKNMAKDLLKSMILEQYFDGLQEDFRKKIAEEGMSPDTAAYIIGSVNGAMERLGQDMPYWNQVLTGLADLWEGIDEEASSIGAGTALTSASQESIDLLNGQLNAMRTVQGRMDNTINNILLEMRGFRGDMNGNFAETNDKLSQLISNTSKNNRYTGAYV